MKDEAWQRLITEYGCDIAWQVLLNEFRKHESLAQPDHRLCVPTITTDHTDLDEASK